MLKERDLIRSRELHCFALKKIYKQADLGVGIAFTLARLVPRIDSEFDLVSLEVYLKPRVLRSVHGIPYNLWLPLPLSHRHWARVQGEAGWTLRHIARHLTNPGDVCGRPPYLRVSTAKVVFFFFMSDIVVRLNLDLERQQDSSGCRRRQRRLRYPDENSETEEEKEEEEEDWLPSNERRRTLRRASEKAIESYFQLLHLLLCLATGPDGEDIVAEANEMIRSFLGGRGVGRTC